jgi:glucokinase
MNEDGMMLEKIRESFKKYAFHACRKAKIEKAQLGNDAGIYGAAFLATLG